jgi:hypothetical protein
MKPMANYELSDARLKVMAALACLIVVWLFIRNGGANRPRLETREAARTHFVGDGYLGVEGSRALVR